MACVDKDDFVAAVLDAFWQQFYARFPSAKRAAMVAAFDGREVATASDSWWRDIEMTDRASATVKVISHCNGDEVTFELVRS